MKKIFVLILAMTVFLALPFNLNAEEEQSEDNDSVITTITFDNIKEDMLDRNPTLKILKNNRLNVTLSNSVMIDQINDNITQLMNLKNSLQSDKTALEESAEYNLLKNQVIEIEDRIRDSWYNIDIDTINPADAAVITAYQAQVNLKVTYENQILKAEAQVDGLRDQLADNNEDLSNAISKLALNSEKLTYDLIRGAKELILTHEKVNLQKNTLEKRIKQLERELEIMDVRKKLGYIIDENIDGVIQQYDQLSFTLETIKYQIKSIEQQINILLGQDVDIELNIVPPVIGDDISEQITMNDGDIVLLLENNYEIKVQELELGIKIVELSREYEEYSIPYQIALRDRENEEIKLEDIKRSVHSAFLDLRDKVNQSQLTLNNEYNSLQSAKRKIDSMAVKYDLGLISKVDYEREKAEYEIQKNNMQNAKVDLYTNYLQYQWMINSLESLDDAENSKQGGLY